MKKPFRLPATMLVIALVAFLFVGCGGGDDEETAPPPKQENASNNQSSAAPVVPSSMPEQLVGQAVVPTNESPDDFTEAIEDNQTIVVTFYMPSPYDDIQVRSSIMTLQSSYRGQVEFFSYLYSDAQSYKDLATLLQVNTTPTVVVINRNGVVQRAWTGYADEQTLEQGIVEALAES